MKQPPLSFMVCLTLATTAVIGSEKNPFGEASLKVIVANYNDEWKAVLAD